MLGAGVEKGLQSDLDHTSLSAQAAFATDLVRVLLATFPSQSQPDRQPARATLPIQADRVWAIANHLRLSTSYIMGFAYFFYSSAQDNGDLFRSSRRHDSIISFPAAHRCAQSCLLDTMAEQ